MSELEPAPQGGSRVTRQILKTAPVIIVGSVMFSFISYWRVAAVVLCDLASTAFYIGGIVEQAIGPAAPWYILAVMMFSYAVRAVYIESCSLFVRGGVYRVVKTALGGLPAKGAVSALLFDYILTGPISSVSAGQYLTGLVLESAALLTPNWVIQDPAVRGDVRRVGSVIVAIAITLYFFRKNLIGMHESSGKALRIMSFTTVVAVTVLCWCGVTLAIRGPVNRVPFAPDLSPKVHYAVTTGTDRLTGEPREMWVRDAETGRLAPQLENGQPIPRISSLTGRQEDPLGFLPHVFPGLADRLRGARSVFTLFGLLGLMVAFGHSILAMSGEETMAQVYREVESPKLKNFKKAAFVIFIYSLILTAGVSFLAVLLIPDEVRMKDYADNLLGGLAMHVYGPPTARLVLNALVVVAGFLILAGAVNTSIIGSNGVLNRVAEDGVLPDRLQKPHPRFGTTYRMLYLIVGLQLLTIIASRGDMVLLGEAYAFGVIWSFLFNSLSMLMLRFKDHTPREFKVPLNVRVGTLELPIGLGLVFLVLLASAITNLFTKEVATTGGVIFTSLFMGLFMISERMTGHHRKMTAHEHIEQFTEQSTLDVSQATVGLTKPYRKLVAIRSPQNLYMLQKALEETDPETTEVVVMTAKTTPPGGEQGDALELDRYDRKLMTAVIELAEKAGKHMTPLVVPTNNPLFAVINTAKSLGVQELVVGASNKFTAEEQLDQMTFYWINLHGGNPTPLTIRVLTRGWDVHFDVAGGFRIPRISELKCRNVAELRAAGVGVSRVLLAHDGTPGNSDVFQAVLTMLDPDVSLALVRLPHLEESDENPAGGGEELLHADCERARKIGRDVEVHEITGDPGAALVRLARDGEYGLVVLYSPAASGGAPDARRNEWIEHVREHVGCPVFVATPPCIPREVAEANQTAQPVAGTVRSS